MFAAYYLIGEVMEGGEKHLYEVEMAPRSRHPMALVNAAFQTKSAAEFERLAREYWLPEKAWKIWEYLGDEMEIVEEREWPHPDEVAGVKFKYVTDMSTMRRVRRGDV